MKHLTRTILLLVGWVTGVAHAAVPDNVTERIVEQLRLFPQEKVVLHTDRTHYADGDRIWFKATCMDAVTHFPSDLSQYIYVELVAADGLVLKRVKSVNNGGWSCGQVDIPQETAAGVYYLRAYTLNMTNRPDFIVDVPLFVGCHPADSICASVQEPSVPQSGVWTLDSAAPGGLLTVTTRGHHIVIEAARSVPHSATLLVHCRCMPCLDVALVPGSTISVPADSLPSGVVGILLLDGEMRLLEQHRLCVMNAADLCVPVIAATQSSLTREDCRVNLDINIPGLEADELASLSVSVSPQEQSNAATNPAVDLFLATDCSHGLGWKSVLTDDVAEMIPAGADYARYHLPDVLQGNYETPRIGAEETSSLTGRVVGLLRKRPVKGARVSCIVPQSGTFAVGQTDEKGCFRLTGFDYPDGAAMVVRATDSHGGENVQLTVDEETFLPVEPSRIISEPVGGQIVVADTAVKRSRGSVQLGNITVRAFKLNARKDGNEFSRLSDYSLSQDQIEEFDATCLHELLRRVPGVRIVGNRCYIRSHNSIYGDNPASIAVDGFLLGQDYDLDLIDMHDVATVDVFKSGSTAIWGLNGGSGVISVTTKTGSHRPRTAVSPNMTTVRRQGYQLPLDFVADEQAIVQGTPTTLYWNPHIEVNGCDSCRLSFHAPYARGSYALRVQGITTSGRLVTGSKIIQIQ